MKVVPAFNPQSTTDDRQPSSRHGAGFKVLAEMSAYTKALCMKKYILFIRIIVILNIGHTAVEGQNSLSKQKLVKYKLQFKKEL